MMILKQFHPMHYAMCSLPYSCNIYAICIMYAIYMQYACALPLRPYSSFAGRDASRGLATFSVEPVSVTLHGTNFIDFAIFFKYLHTLYLGPFDYSCM